MEKGFKQRLFERVIKKIIKIKFGAEIGFDVENVDLIFHLDGTTGLYISNLYILAKNEDIERIIRGE